jgi:hypothetical protein
MKIDKNGNKNVDENNKIKKFEKNIEELKNENMQ